MASPYKKRKMPYGDRDTQGEVHLMAEAEIGATSPGTLKIESSHPEAKKRQEKKDPPLQPLEGTWPC